MSITNVGNRPGETPAGGNRPATAADRGPLARWRALPVPQRATDDPPFSPLGRLLVAAATLALGVLGVLGRLTGWDAPATVALVVYLTLGLGVAACLPFRRLSPSAFGLFSVTAGLAITTAVGFLMAQTSWWFPVTAALLAGVAGAVSLVYHGLIDLRAVRGGRFDRSAGLAARHADRQRINISRPGLLAGGGSALCLVGAALATSLPQEGGLLATVNPLWFVGYALIAAAFVDAVFTRRSLAAPVLAAGTVVIASQAILYGAPTVMAVGRHLGLTDFIMVNGGLSASVDIYQAWPGLFAGTAWIVQATGITDPLLYATWWPVVITPALILGVRVLAGRLLPARKAWIAAAVFAVGGSVNSMYFAPQVSGLLLTLAVLALTVLPVATDSRREHWVRLGVCLFFILTMVVTHQISPFMLGLALLALVLFRLVGPWWLPLMAFVPAVGWALLHLGVLERYIDIGAIGSVLSNIAPPEHPDPVAGVALVTRTTFLVPGAALVVLGLVALAGVIRMRDRWSFGLLAATASPIGLAFATNYGQEGIFRVVLFATPWMAILVARTVSFRFPSVRVAVAAGFVVMMAVNVYGQTALDWARVVRVNDADAVAQFERTAADNALLLSVGTKNATPARITEDYDRVGYTSRERLKDFPGVVGDDYDAAADVVALTARFSAIDATEHYALVSDSIGAYDDRYGLQRYDDYVKLKNEMAESNLWIPVFSTENTTLYKLAGEPVG